MDNHQDNAAPAADGEGPVTRAASSSQQTADGASGGTGAAALPLTSGQLKYRPMRLYTRRARARVFINRILDHSAFIFLEEEQQAQIRQLVEECVKDDINKFFDENAPRSLYPYESRVMAAVRTVFTDNMEMFTFEDEQADQCVFEELLNIV